MADSSPTSTEPNRRTSARGLPTPPGEQPVTEAAWPVQSAAITETSRRRARVIHFEISADDPERAAEFYRRVFGWEITGWGGPVPYLLASTGPQGSPGIDGAITDRRTQHQPVVNSIGVESWDEAATAVVAAGGQVLMEKTLIPGVGYFAYCMDTEGNVFGIVEESPTDPAAPLGDAGQAAG